MSGRSIQWQKSSFSGAEGPECLEVARAGDELRIRESEAPERVLAVTRADVARLVAGVKAGTPDRW